MKSIAERISNLRKVNRWTQSDLAKKLNVSSKLVSKWETGEGQPSLEDIINLGKVFQVSVDYLSTGTMHKGDEKSINKQPTFEQYTEDLKEYLKKILKANKLEKYYDSIVALITDDEVDKWIRNLGAFPYEKILTFDNYNLYKLLEDNELIYRTPHIYKSFKENENGFRIEKLTQHKIKDPGFYKGLDANTYSGLIADFIYGRREWDDRVILLLIEQGGQVFSVAPGQVFSDCVQELRFVPDVFQTKLLQQLCENNLKTNRH